MGAAIMDNKAEILQIISSSLADGTISRGDLESILNHHARLEEVPSEQKSRKQLSAVDVMFYIAGIVLFAAIAALVGQSWDAGLAVRILLSAGVGTMFWAVALYFITKPQKSDIQKGMTNALLLTGSLSIISGGFIITSELVDFSEINFYAISLTLAILGAFHIGFGWQIKRSLLLLIGTFLATGSFPAFVMGLLGEADLPLFVYCLIIALSGGLLIYTTRVVSRIAANENIGHAFDPLGAFTILMSLYAASFDETTGILWLLALILGIIGLFYLSIITQNKLLLGNGSFFLVIAIITISYRYFSDNIAISLLISAAGLLGTAIMAAHINRRYLN